MVLSVKRIGSIIVNRLRRSCWLLRSPCFSVVMCLVHEYRMNLFFAHMMMTIPHPHNHRHSQHQPVFHEYRLNLFIAHM